jgi:hypothetical protein
MRCAAQNHAVSGSLERCIVVPAVTEVCRPQSRHSCKRGRLFSPTARRLPQPGQTKPSGQRRLNKNAAQLSSSGNDFWNSASDRPLAIGTRPRDRANPIAHDTTSRETCVNGISLVARLRAYRAERSRLLGPTTGPFFLIESGERPTDCCARYNFAIVSQDLGLREPQRFCKHGRGPRIHDLRHTFAVRTIMGWYRKGLDPDREMIKLSTYLGHSKPENTYWYIEAVPELLQLASARAERSLAASASQKGGAR